MKENIIKFSDVDTAGDVKDFITMSKDISYENEKVKDFIFSCDDSDLLKVTKTINSPIKIIEVVKIDDNYIKDNL